MKRRTFIQHGATFSCSLPFLMNGMSIGAAVHPMMAAAMNEDSDRVLILIQLNGGNDGLSMIPPLNRYDRLANHRRNILIPQNEVLKINNTVGFHPAMLRIKSELYDAGKATVIQSVGYPNPIRSHFRSTDIMMTGSPAEEIWSSGWVGRYLDKSHPNYPYGYPNSDFPDPFAITMGSLISLTCQGLASNYSLAIENPFRLFPIAEGAEDIAPNTPYGEELAFLRTSIVQTNAYSEVILKAANKGANTVTYDVESNRLAKQLKNVALLMSGGMRTKVYVVQLGGFDTHAGQAVEGSPSKGAYAELMVELSEGIATFMKDLRNQGMEQRVLAMTFSEFGRQIKENASFGSDHGTAAPMLMFGPCVSGGVIGDTPEIPAQLRSQEAIPMQYDFRNVYGSVLMDWMGMKEADVKQLLFNGFQYMPLIDCAATPTSTQQLRRDETFQMEISPNPFHENTTISFECGNELIRLSLFDANGAEIKVMINKYLQAGSHTLTLNMLGFPDGNYYCRISGAGQRQLTKSVVKL
ncbi:MAG: DUF1501 domain-containing protein [Saprospiraceae bacterium]|nr:DUF1501 domain-containing protein [Saprospiraceae bacterium]